MNTINTFQDDEILKSIYNDEDIKNDLDNILSHDKTFETMDDIMNTYSNTLSNIQLDENNPDNMVASELLLDISDEEIESLQMAMDERDIKEQLITENMEHQLTESSILKNSNSSSSSILKSNYMLNAIESDTDTAISDSKIIFDVNRFHIIDLPNTTTSNKPTESVSITRHSNNMCIRSHSEQLLSPPSELWEYECFYLFDDNNKEPSIIDEKKTNPIHDIIINDYFKINNDNNIDNKPMIYSPITMEQQIINKSIDRSHINGTNILHSDNNNNNNNNNIIDNDHDEAQDDSEYDSFSLFNDYDSSSENENEFQYKPNKSTFKINVPTIQIPLTRNDYLTQVRPAFKLHLEMVDNDGSIRREIMEHREKYNHNRKDIKPKRIYINDDNINMCGLNISKNISKNKSKNKTKNKNKNKNKNKSKDKKRKRKRTLSFKKKLCNVFNYFIFENKSEVDVTLDVDYFKKW